MANEEIIENENNISEEADHGDWVRGRDGNWYGSSANKSKLPVLPDEQAGTWAICTDTQELGCFNQALGVWQWKA